MTPTKYFYKITIHEVELEHQGEWEFTFVPVHRVSSTFPLTAEHIRQMVEGGDFDLEIQADIDGVYEDGYTITEYTYEEEDNPNGR